MNNKVKGYVEIYNEETCQWEYAFFREIKKGDIFFAYNGDGDMVPDEQGFICHIAKEDAVYNGTEWEIELEEI